MNCPKCNTKMLFREHKEITEKLLKKPYYFTHWWFCKKCGYVQHKEEYKIRNDLSS